MMVVVGSARVSVRENTNLGMSCQILANATMAGVLVGLDSAVGQKSVMRP